MGLFKFLFNSTEDLQKKTNLSSQEQPKAIQTKEEGFEVAGIKYYMENLISICPRNPDYELKKAEIIKRNIENSIFEYQLESDNVQLIPEPDNAHDPRAIKVIINEQHIGYIKKGSCGHIHNLLNSKSIIKIHAFIHGAKRKFLTYSESGNLVLEHSEGGWGVKLTITISKQS